MAGLVILRSARYVAVCRQRGIENLRRSLEIIDQCKLPIVFTQLASIDNEILINVSFCIWILFRVTYITETYFIHVIFSQQFSAWNDKMKTRAATAVRWMA